MSEQLQTGVIGVGTMGQHHARVYSELSEARLLGVADRDVDRAGEIASQYETDVFPTEKLIELADAVSVVVPTGHHYDVAKRCIEAGVDVLVEKPFVETIEQGRDLAARANAADVVLQVGHIERFNPVVETLQEIAPGLEVVSVSAERLGPRPNRPIQDSVVADLMIHDIDVINSLTDGSISEITACGNADGRHAMATAEFDSGVVASLTASRITQRKVRQLTITAESCYVSVDYTDQSIQIYRQSFPEYITDDGDLRYRHESIVENPVVENREPLKKELRSFLRTAETGGEPRVTGEDGIQSLLLTRKINEKAFGTPDKQVGVMME